MTSVLSGFRMYSRSPSVSLYLSSAPMHFTIFDQENSLNREVKHDVYGKRQTAKMKVLPSVFSSLYSRIKIFVFAVNSKRHFSIFV